MFDFSDLIAERTKDFAGRDWVFQAIDQWLAGGGDKSNIFLISGGPGTGKTAVMARLVQILRGEIEAQGFSQLNPGWPIFFHFCQIKDEYGGTQTENSLSAPRLVEALSLQLSKDFPAYARALTRVGNQAIKIDADLKVETIKEGATVNNVVIKNLTVGNLSAREAFEDLVRQPMSEVRDEIPRSGEHTLCILVDAIDEALAFNPDTEFLEVIRDASHLPISVKVIVTSRPDGRVTNLFGDPSLDLIRSAPDNARDVELYAGRRLSGFDPDLRSNLAQKIALASQGNFLYAFYVVTELISDPDQIIEDQEIPLPNGLDGVYLQFLRRELARNLERWEERYRPILGLLVVARPPGLTRLQLAGASNLPESAVNDSVRACAQFLQESGTGALRFYHPSFQTFLIENQTYQIFPAEASQSLGQYFIREYGNNWITCPEPYGLEFTISHLIEAARATTLRQERFRLHSQIRELLSDLAYLQARYRNTNGDLTTIISDLRQVLDFSDLEPMTRQELGGLKDIFDREQIRLDKLSPEEFPDFLALQIYYQAHNQGLDTWLDICISYFQKTGILHFAPNWRQLGGHLAPGEYDSVPMEGLTLSNLASMQAIGKVTLEEESQPGEDRQRFEISYQRGAEQLEWMAHWSGSQAGLTDQPTLDRLEGRARLRSGEIHWMMKLDQPDQGMDSAKTINAGISFSGGKAEWRSHRGAGDHLMTSMREMISISGVGVTPLGLLPIRVAENNILAYWSYRLGEAWVFEPNLIDEFSASLRLGGYIKPEDQPMSYQQSMTIERQKRAWSVKIEPKTQEELNVFDHKLSIGAVEGRLIGAQAVVMIPELMDLVEDWFPFIAITQMVITPDNRSVIKANCDGSLDRLDLSSGTRLDRLVAHDKLVFNLQITQDGRRLISASLDGTIKIWRCDQTWSCWTIARPGAIPCTVNLARGDRWLFIAWSDSTLQTWDIDQEKTIHTWSNHPGDGLVCQSTTLRQRDWVVTGDTGGKLQVWDLFSGQSLQQLAGHQRQITTLITSRTGLQVLSAALDGDFIRWDLSKDGERIPLMSGINPQTKAAFSPDGSLLLAWVTENQLAIWNTADWTLTYKIFWQSVPPLSILPMPDNNHFVTTELWKPYLLYWSLSELPGASAGQEPERPGKPKAYLRLDEPVGTLRLTPDQKMIFVGGNLGGIHCLGLPE